MATTIEDMGEMERRLKDELAFARKDGERADRGMEEGEWRLKDVTGGRGKWSGGSKTNLDWHEKVVREARA
eukprot:70721-Chlamydomonas_euryale.AAC.1